MTISTARSNAWRPRATIAAVVAGMLSISLLAPVPASGVHDPLAETLHPVKVLGYQWGMPQWDPYVMDISGDGRHVVFESSQPGLVSGVDDDLQHIYHHDRETGSLEIISVNTTGAVLVGREARISGDGRYVAFNTYQEPIPEFGASDDDVFVRDLEADSTVRVSKNSAGDDANDVSYSATLSNDGMTVLFESVATNLAAVDPTPNFYDLFVRDRTTGITEMVPFSEGSWNGVGPIPSWQLRCSDPILSGDGRFVLMGTRYALDPDDINGVPGENTGCDGYVWDRQADTFELITFKTDGGLFDTEAIPTDISDDGRFVTFKTSESGGPEDTNNAPDIFIRDRLEQMTERITVDGTEQFAYSSVPAARATFSEISGDGRFVSYMTTATNLIPGDYPADGDLFLYDRWTKINRQINVPTGVQNEWSESNSVILTTNGRFGLFTSGGPYLAYHSAGGLNMYLYDRWIAQAFNDVPPGHPFFDDVMWNVDQMITTGYDDGGYHPADPVTRQAMAAFIYRAAGSPDGVDPTCAIAAFPDVPAAQPFCGEIAWLVDEGITTGYDDGGYHPADPVTRQAMAAFIHRSASQLAP